MSAVTGVQRTNANTYNFNQMMDQIRGTARSGKQMKNALFQGTAAFASGKQQGQMFLSLAGANGSAAAKLSLSANNTASGKKESGYNHSSYTSQIKQAKSPQNIRMIAAEIRAQIMDLRTKLATGEYDEEEIVSAIAHAEALAHAAESRADNLEKEMLAERRLKRKELEEELYGEDEEEDKVYLPADEDALMTQAQKRMEKEVEKEMQKLMEQMQKEMAEELSEEMEELMEEAEEEDPLDALDEMAAVLKGSMSEEDIEEMKKKHRAAEDMEIARADMDYLKSKFQRLQRQKEALANGTATFELAGQQMNAKEMSTALKAMSQVAKTAGKASAGRIASSGGMSGSAHISAGDAFSGASISVGGSVDVSG